MAIYSFRPFNRQVFYFYYEDRFGWFRLFGKGLAWKDTVIHPKLFSERYGLTKFLMIGRWLIKYLP